MKIQIIGYSGAGKSTLAKKLATFYNIPYLHLDNVKFYGDWQEHTKEQQEQTVQKFLDENEDWVIDGNFSSILPIRFEMSDITIYLNYNRFYCYKMCKKRYEMHKDNPRESCPCKDKLDKDFKRWILFEGRTRKKRKKHLQNLNKTKGTKLIFKNRKQLEKWLTEIGCN